MMRHWLFEVHEYDDEYRAVEVGVVSAPTLDEALPFVTRRLVELGVPEWRDEVQVSFVDLTQPAAEGCWGASEGLVRTVGFVDDPNRRE